MIYFLYFLLHVHRVHSHLQLCMNIVSDLLVSTARYRSRMAPTQPRWSTDEYLAVARIYVYIGQVPVTERVLNPRYPDVKKLLNGGFNVSNTKRSPGAVYRFWYRNRGLIRQIACRKMCTPPNGEVAGTAFSVKRGTTTPRIMTQKMRTCRRCALDDDNDNDDDTTSGCSRS